MAVVFQPPPTWADVVLTDETTKKSKFNPVWLKWFVDLVSVVNSAGGGSGGIVHDELSGLQGGSTNQMYHQSQSEYSYSQGLVAGTVAVVCTTLTSKDTKICKTSVGFSNGAGAAVGTLNNAPAVGNPTKWIPIDDNGTTRYIPAW